MIWVWIFIAAAIVALVIEAIHFEKNMTASCSRTEALRRLLTGERTANQRPPAPEVPQSRTMPQTPGSTPETPGSASQAH